MIGSRAGSIMRADRGLALQLRRQDKSYGQISRSLGVPKSTLAAWFRYDRLSQKTKRLLVKRAREKSRQTIKKLVASNKIRWEQWREKAREEARQTFSSLIKNSLFVSGLMLYWAEGDSKVWNPFRLTNTDPRMIALYTRFLVVSLKIPKETIRPTVILYPDLNEERCIRFWSKTIGVPKSQFYKTQFIKGHHPTRRLAHGICMITCGNRQLKEKVIVWIDLLSKKLLQ